MGGPGASGWNGSGSQMALRCERGCRGAAKKGEFPERAPLFTAAWWARAPGGHHPRPSCRLCATGRIRPTGSRAPGFPGLPVGRGDCVVSKPGPAPARLQSPELYQCYTEFQLNAWGDLHVRELTGSLE